MDSGLRITGDAEVKALAADLKAAGASTLRKAMRASIVASGQEMKTDAKRNALAIPVHGKTHTGLRQAIARATYLRVNLTPQIVRVTLEVSPSRMPAGQQNLPKRMEGGRGRPWRHPVFGNTDVWVEQESHPYFWPAVRKHITQVRAGVAAAVEETRAQLSRGAL